MNDFLATHAITFRPESGPEQRWEVMLDDEGHAYTRQEWDQQESADWTYNAADGWRCLGQMTPGGANGEVLFQLIGRWYGWISGPYLNERPRAALAQPDLQGRWLTMAGELLAAEEVTRLQTTERAALDEAWSRHEAPRRAAALERSMAEMLERSQRGDDEALTPDEHLRLALTDEEAELAAEALDLLAERRAKSAEWAEKQRRLTPGRADHFAGVEREARGDLADTERILARFEALLAR